MNEIEIWKDIDGYEGKYQVSNLGRIKSLKDRYGNTIEKILKPGKIKNGYLIVILCKNGTKKTSKVHRLVANAFIPNTNNFRCVNHKDENKENNCVENLEWCTYQYNNTYRNLQQRRVANIDWKNIGRKNAEKLSKKVYQYSLDGELIKIWKSTSECHKNKFDSGHVSACCRNCYLREGNNVYKGYIWSYIELKK